MEKRHAELREKLALIKHSRHRASEIGMPKRENREKGCR